VFGFLGFVATAAAGESNQLWLIARGHRIKDGLLLASLCFLQA
jgi:hypothetical protein